MLRLTLEKAVKRVLLRVPVKYHCYQYVIVSFYSYWHPTQTGMTHFRDIPFTLFFISWHAFYFPFKPYFSVMKVEVVLEQILKIKHQFSEDRRKPSLSFNEEQIHKYEKYVIALPAIFSTMLVPVS